MIEAKWRVIIFIHNDAWVLWLKLFDTTTTERIRCLGGCEWVSGTSRSEGIGSGCTGSDWSCNGSGNWGLSRREAGEASVVLGNELLLLKLRSLLLVLLLELWLLLVLHLLLLASIELLLLLLVSTDLGEVILVVDELVILTSATLEHVLEILGHFNILIKNADVFMIFLTSNYLESKS